MDTRVSLTERFEAEARAAGCDTSRVPDGAAAVDCLRRWLDDRGIRQLVYAHSPVTEGLSLPQALRAMGVAVVEGTDPAFAQAVTRVDLGLSGASLAVAETGSLLLGATEGPGWQLATSLPKAHFALIRAEQIVPDLAEALAFIREQLQAGPRDFAFITGPSRSVDIAFTPTIGVHGPGKVHVIVIER